MRAITRSSAGSIVRPAVVCAVAGLALSACGSEDGAGDTASDPGVGAASVGSPADPDAALTTADSSVGEIVVDGEGRAVYLYDEDTQGAAGSACTGSCAESWPAVTSESDQAGDLRLGELAGEVGTITGVDGSPQLTLEGWPLYYYAADEPGELAGQGVGEVWWVLAPDGSAITELPTRTEDEDTGGGGGYGY